MEQTIIYTIASFVLGFFLGAIIFKKKTSENLLFATLTELRKSLDEYKNQNELNTKEVKEAIKDASKLTKILTTNQNIKGQFGEDCLENIIKTCYPKENIDYIKQYQDKNPNDKTIRPDFLIKLPNNKSILIDCKVKLEKYIEFKENQDETISQEKKSEFIKDINTTINNLADKKYQNALNTIQPDFILMYIPLEPIITMLYTDNDYYSIIKNSIEKNVIIVGNSSILTVIKLTKQLWAQEKQNNNVEKIISIAENIYELIAQHTQNLFTLKTQLEENTKKFNKEFDNISNNKLFQNIEQLREYGIQLNSKKVGKKVNEIEIHKDFIN